MTTDAERQQLLADYETLVKRLAECHITVPMAFTPAGQQGSSDGDHVLASAIGSRSDAALPTNMAF